MDGLLQRAFAAHQANDLVQAEDLYRQVLQVQPDSSDAWHLLGVILKYKGDLEGALIHMQRAITIDPHSATIRSNLGNAHFSAGQVAEAAKEFEQAYALGGTVQDRDKAVGALLHLSRQESDPLARRALLMRAHELLPGESSIVENIIELSEGDFATALPYAQKAFDLRSSPWTWERLWGIATHVSLPVDAARALVDENPDDPLRWLILGNSHRREFCRHWAEDAYANGLARAPGHPLLESRLACLLVEAGRLEEAERLFRGLAMPFPTRERVIALAPEFFEGLRRAPPVRRGITFHAQAQGAKGIVFSGADAVYFEKFGARLLKSLTMNAPDFGIHLHICNPTPDTFALLDKYRAHLGRDIGLSTIQVDIDQFGGSASGVYSCERFLALPEIMAAYDGARLIMVDIDQIVVRDLTPLVAASGRSDFAMVEYHANQTNPWHLFSAFVISIAPTPGARDYFHLVARYLWHFFQRQEAIWFLDQIALVCCWLAGYDGRPAPRRVGLTHDLCHSGTLVRNGQELPLPPGTLFWPYYASVSDLSLLTSLPTFRKYEIP